MEIQKILESLMLVRRPMKQRSTETAFRNGPKLDLFQMVGPDKRINLIPMAAYIIVVAKATMNPSIMDLSIKTMYNMNGMSLSRLSKNQKRFCKYIVSMGNAYLIHEILKGRYPDAIWTFGLRAVVQKTKMEIALISEQKYAENQKGFALIGWRK